MLVLTGLHSTCTIYMLNNCQTISTANQLVYMVFFFYQTLNHSDMY